MKVITFGVFDYFHLGHLRLFERCAKLGDYFIVAVQVDEEISKTKPSSKILYNFNERSEMIRSIKYVDEVVPYKQIDDDISKFDFDILVVGPDQNHIGFQRAIKWCNSHNKKVVVLERTEGISSTKIKTIASLN